MALAGAGGDDEPADVARAAYNQHPAPFLMPRADDMSGIGVQKRGRTEELIAHCSDEDWGKDKDRDARQPALRREDGEGTPMHRRSLRGH